MAEPGKGGAEDEAWLVRVELEVYAVLMMAPKLGVDSESGSMADEALFEVDDDDSKLESCSVSIMAEGRGGSSVAAEAILRHFCL